MGIEIETISIVAIKIQLPFKMIFEKASKFKYEYTLDPELKERKKICSLLLISFSGS